MDTLIWHLCQQAAWAVLMCMLQTLVELKAKGESLPRVLYLVPNGQNPVSYVAPLQRKQALYCVCRKYDLMIVEDDPYFYLQFPYDSKPLILYHQLKELLYGH